uniref:Putative conserved secreted protein salivary gland overexpressed n=1 Tax=Rhipicephalus microplus TaxID=6941 RepID=A0A6M2CY89_RHIMP
MSDMKSAGCLLLFAAVLIQMSNQQKSPNTKKLTGQYPPEIQEHIDKCGLKNCDPYKPKSSCPPGCTCRHKLQSFGRGFCAIANKRVPPSLYDKYHTLIS